MGILDRFRTEEHKKVIRDEEGNVRLKKTYSRGGSRTPVSDALLSQRKEERKADRTSWKQQQRDEYRKAYREARLKRIREGGRRAGSTTWGDRLGSWADNMSKSSYGGTRSRPARKISKGYYSSPMESIFTIGGGPPRQKSSGKKKHGKKGKRDYVIRGGVAYPVAGGKRKKKKSKHRGYSNPFEFKF